MKNLFLAGCLIVGIAGVASAAPSYPRVDVRELAVDVSTTSTIDIASITATAVALSTVFGSTVNIWAIEVYVPSGESAVNCGWDSAVSTRAVTSQFGREVAVGTGVLWQTDYNKNTLYCRSQLQKAADTKSRATVTLFR